MANFELRFKSLCDGDYVIINFLDKEKFPND